MSQDPLTMWQVESLRFSVFLASLTEPETVSSWVDIVGQDIDDTHLKGTGEQRVVSQQGPFAEAMMRVEVRRDRFDWHLLPPQSTTPNTKPTVGSYEKVKDQFQRAMLTWLDTANPIANRVAYGAVLSLRSGGRSDSLRVLDNLLSTVNLDPQNTWDFDYSVNRRRKSNSISNLMINRLAKWSLDQGVLGVVELPTGGGPPRINATTSHVPMLTLDINTMPEFTHPLHRLKDLLKELIELGTEIASNGDVP